ncbi:TonB-dependent receptor domain-containing protein [Candidatus Neomarinimicrobiota bacterium]
MKTGLLTIALMLPQLAMAGNTGKLAGRVTDSETGEALAGANMIVGSIWVDGEEVPLDITPGGATDGNGEYFILNIPPGKYTLRAFYIGYNTEARTQVQVMIDKTTRIDFALARQNIEGEEVLITAYRPDRVEKDLTATKQVYNVGEIQSMAGVSDISDILNLQADVVDDHFRGGRTGESQYILGGGSIVNPLTNRRAFAPIVTGLEQVEVYTSGFSAEYGNAQSGVVNMATREGQSQWSSRAELAVVLPYYKTWGGSPYNTENILFYDQLMNTAEWLKDNPTQPGRLLFDGGYGFGPLYLHEEEVPDTWPPTPPNPLTMTDSLHSAELGQILWLQSVRDIGLEYDNTLDYRLDFTAGGPIAENIRIFFAGRQNRSYSIVPTPQPNLDRQIMTTVTYQPSSSNKFKFNYIYDVQYESELGSAWQRWMFDRTFGVTQQKRTTAQYGSEWEHLVNNNMFFNLRFKILDVKSIERVELLSDGEFVEDYSSNANWVDYTGPSNHRVSRPEDDRGDEFVRTYSLDANITRQADNNNLFKAGLQLNFYDVDVDREMNASSEGSFRAVQFKVQPMEGALYFQDKLEFEGLIAVLGLRYDFYDLNADYYSDLFSPLRNPNYDPSLPYLERGLYYDRDLAGLTESKMYTKLQPRFGFSFPVSEDAVFHLNYGTFTQRPNFNQIFYSQITAFNEIEVLGNPRLKPENTKTYDVGWVKGLPFDMRLDISAYYKDVKDLIETAYYYDDLQSVYRTYVNRDYADIKGFHVSVEKNTGRLRGFMRYNYESATGKSSNDLDAPVTYFENPAKGQAAIELPDPEDVYLDYDRTHKTVMNLRYVTRSTVGLFGGLSISTTYRISTGRPYTWDSTGKGLKFSQRTPSERELRLRFEKRFTGSMPITMYAEVFNVLNESFYHYSRTFDDGWNTPKWWRKYERTLEDGSTEEYYDHAKVLEYDEYYPYVSDQSISLLRNEPRHIRVGMIVKF